MSLIYRMVFLSILLTGCDHRVCGKATGAVRHVDVVIIMEPMYSGKTIIYYPMIIPAHDEYEYSCTDGTTRWEE